MSTPAAPRPAHRSRTRRRVRYVAALLSAIVAGSAGGASAAFTSTQSNAGNRIVVGDTVAPVIARATVAKVPTGSTAGQVRAGADYYVYAEVTDAWGVATVTADTPAGPAATTALSTTDGPWTIGGATYTWRSPLLTATAGQTTGTSRTYQVRATDNAGLNATPISPTVTVETYRQALVATPGLLSHWRLDATFAAPFAGNDLFERAGTLQSANSTSNHAWTRRSGNNTDATLITHATERGVRRSGATVANASIYQFGADPGSDNYAVEADIYVRTLVNGDTVRLRARAAAGDFLGYEAGYRVTAAGGAGQWYIARGATAIGTYTDLATAAVPALPVGANRVRLEVEGTTIRLIYNGNDVLTVTDGTTTRRGFAGLYLAGTTAPAAEVGLHVDNFEVVPLTATPSADLTGTRALNIAGPPATSPSALVGDTNLSLRFDGFADRGHVTRPVQDAFSIELWFNSTQGLLAGAQWWDAAGLVDADVAGNANDFGVGLDGTGRVVAGVGNADTSLHSAGGLNNGVWHHVVFTRTRATGNNMVLYVDGAQVDTDAGSTGSLTAPANLWLGQSALGGKRFRGQLDELALYNTALTAAQVQDHWLVGHGGTR